MRTVSQARQRAGFFFGGLRRTQPLRIGVVFAVALFAGTVARAAELTIRADELGRPPSRERLDELHAAAQRGGWGVVEPGLRLAAISAYEREPGLAAPWFNLFRWAALWATPRRRAIEQWTKAIEAAGGGHANMANRYELKPGALGAEVSPELQRWLLGNLDFAQEFFATLSPQDQPVAVLGILQQVYADNPALFAEYASLALAIAVVYDVPPPPDWPHGQVSPLLLPRRLPLPVDAFRHWTQMDRAGVAAHRLRRLTAAELKFVVDTSTPFTELQWAQRNVTPPLAQLATAYTMVRYRNDRLTQSRFDWPLRSYSLETILREGGICVDQAYFAAQVGKARGVPTLLFRGAGLDGRHAWFGFLSPNGWVLDAGRYAEQKFVAGQARDPQTWREFTDHELLFLSERFRAAPLYRLSAIHADYAELYWRDGRLENALRAARESVNREPRNVRGWQVLVAVQTAAKLPVREQENTLREAMRALQRYPDLEREFGQQLTASLRQRGEVDQAGAEDLRLVRKFQEGRGDLSIQQVREMMLRSLQTDEVEGTIRVYRRLLDVHGRNAGIEFYDQVVVPVVEHLRRRGQVPAAREALERARRTLRVEKGQQLDREMAALAQRLRGAK
ncbi:MAG: hypothetical protein Q8M02_07030 [Candidatus Didemnitutus sp.]|nr:hypothetical protein [Candidatus Didemnitutus sp.]